MIKDKAMALSFFNGRILQVKRFLPALVCLCVAIILPFLLVSSSSGKISTYPNLPAPIAQEKILITSAGQAVESTVLKSIANQLNLESDYRPRALAADLYDYKSVVIVVGFSKNGLSQTIRSIKEEYARSKELVMEAEANAIPVILVDITGVLREDAITHSLLETVIPHITYYIGLKNTNYSHDVRGLLKENHIPTTLVNHINDIEVPFNSAYR
jgi:hypothetical protein